MADQVTDEQALVNIHYAAAQAEQMLEIAQSQKAYWADQVANAQRRLDAMKKFRAQALERSPELAETPLAKHFS
jgi:hypothetical protein